MDLLFPFLSIWKCNLKFLFSRAHEPDALQSLNRLLADPVRNLPNDEAFRGFEQTTTDHFKEQRERAKIHFNNKEYTDAIDTYSRAILDCEELCGLDYYFTGEGNAESC